MALDDYLVNPGQAPQSPTATPPVMPTPDPSSAQTPAASAQPVPQTPSAPPAMQAQKDPDADTHLKAVKGPFGTKGILGGVLGTLEDALLVGAGLQPVYQPKVAAAKQADAISGWDTDPAGAYIKLANVAGVKSADEALSQWNEMKRQNALTAQTNANTAATVAKTPEEIRQLQLKNKAPLYSTAANLKDDNSAKAFGANVRATYARNGWDTSDLPSDDSLESWKNWSVQGVSPDVELQQNNLMNYRGNRLAQIDRSLDTAAGRAAEQARKNQVAEGLAQQRIDKPAAPRNPPIVTPSRVIGGIMAKAAGGQPLSTSEQKLYDAYQARGRKAGPQINLSPTGAPPPGMKLQRNKVTGETRFVPM